MLELILALALLPTLAISIWDRVVAGMVPKAWLIYRATGLVGTPVHELSHLLACVLFGLRVDEVALYRPRAESGVLGYVYFSYNPRSWVHALGCAVQGVAPLLLSGAIAVYALELTRSPGRPDQGMLPLLGWCWELAGMTVQSFAALATRSVEGAGIAAALLMVCMHGIPSVQDVKVGLRGLIFFIVLVLILGLIYEMYWLLGSPLGPQVNVWIRFLAGEFERGLWWALHGGVLTMTLAVLGSLLLIVFPAGVFSLVSAARRRAGRVA